MKYLLAIFAVITFSGCATKPHTATNVTDDKTVMFAMLGYISEYNSRFMYRDPDDGFIEEFYPGEKKEAFRFDQLMMLYSKLHDQPYEVEKEIGSQGHISFKGEWISKQINQHYAPAPKPYERILTVDPKYILNGNDQQITAYIESALDRNEFKRKKNVISLANAPFLTETIAEALVKLGSEKVDIYAAPPNEIPSSEYIHFSLPIHGFDLKEINEEKELPPSIYRLVKTYSQ